MNLSIKGTLSETIHSIKTDAKFYVLLVLIFFLVSAALLYLMSLAGELTVTKSILYRLLDLAIYVKLAVTVHRAVLLNEAGNWRRFFSWKSKESEFYAISLLYALFIAIAIVVVFFIFDLVLGGWIDGLGEVTKNVLFSVLGLYITVGVMSYVCLVFPNAAIGGQLSLDQCTQITNEVFGKIFFLLAIPQTFGLIIYLLLSFVTYEWLSLLLVPISGLIVIVDIALLSHIYKKTTATLIDEAKTE